MLVPDENNTSSGVSNSGETTASGSGRRTNDVPDSGTGSTGSFAENLKKAVLGSIGKAADAGVLTLTVDPNNPKTPNTRLNPLTGKIEFLNPATNVWMPVTVVLKNNTGNIDLSKFSLQEIQGYLESGTPIPKKPVTAAAPQKATASTETATKTQTKWWVWVVVAVGVGGFLYGVWRLAKRSSKKQS